MEYWRAKESLDEVLSNLGEDEFKKVYSNFVEQCIELKNNHTILAFIPILSSIIYAYNFLIDSVNTQYGEKNVKFAFNEEVIEVYSTKELDKGDEVRISGLDSIDNL